MMKDIPGFNGYKINESGAIINKKGHPLRPAVSNSGYLRVALLRPDAKNKDDRVNVSIHRMVAKTFIPNPEDLPIVLHKDNDKLNNHVSNLEWGTQKDNIQQCVSEGRRNNIYQIYNEDNSSVITCKSRVEVAETIQYSLSSLKNIIGNGRVLANGPYKGYQIRRLTGHDNQFVKERNEPIVPLSFI